MKESRGHHIPGLVMPADTMNWWFCFGLTTVGVFGLTCHEFAARLGRSVDHVEVPFGTVISFAEHVGGIGLAWYWFGPLTAFSVWFWGSLSAFALTVVSGGRYQTFWFLGQMAVLLGGAFWLVMTIGSSWSHR